MIIFAAHLDYSSFFGTSCGYQCPSNIALVKYWGKKKEGIQLPANPSISFTLADIYAKTTITLAYGNVSGKPSFSFLFDGEPKPSFEPKLQKFLQRIWDYSDLVKHFTLDIQSVNNFPHGTGIASSAAGFGAMACVIADLEFQIFGKYPAGLETFEKSASFMARLGSGSACRSLYSQPAIWGENTDLYAEPLENNLHADFSGWKDMVLIVDAGEKKVSSTAGHAILDNNPYAEPRYEIARENLVKIKAALTEGKIRQFIHIVESEALQLHAMMMAGNPYYLLMRPNTVAIIEKIWEFREKQGIPVCFTLDAGANVHLLYPSDREQVVHTWAQNDLLPFCENKQYLCSALGAAPVRC